MALKDYTAIEFFVTNFCYHCNHLFLSAQRTVNANADTTCNGAEQIPVLVKDDHRSVQALQQEHDHARENHAGS